MVETKELRLQSTEELEERQQQLRKEIFQKRSSQAVDREGRPQFNEIAKQRKEIARILTVLSERKKVGK